MLRASPDFSAQLDEGTAAITHAQALAASWPAQRAAWATLLVRCRETRGARAVRGASDVDVPVIAAVLADARLCAACLGQKTGMPVPEVDEILRRIHAAHMIGRCDRCLKQTVVHGLG